LVEVPEASETLSIESLVPFPTQGSQPWAGLTFHLKENTMTEYYLHGLPAEPYTTKVGEWIVEVFKKFIFWTFCGAGISLIGFLFYFGGTFGIWCGTKLINYFGG
jgi:hypothetical protein